MYLRYREPVWDSTETAETAPARRVASGFAARRRRDQLGPSAKVPPRIANSSRTLPQIELNGVKLHAVTEAQVISHILDDLDAGRGGVVVTPNLDHVRRYCHDLSF